MYMAYTVYTVDVEFDNVGCDSRVNGIGVFARNLNK